MKVEFFFGFLFLFTIISPAPRMAPGKLKMLNNIYRVNADTLP